MPQLSMKCFQAPLLRRPWTPDFIHFVDFNKQPGQCVQVNTMLARLVVPLLLVCVTLPFGISGAQGRGDDSGRGASRKQGMSHDAPTGVYGGKSMGGSRKDGMRDDAPPGVYGGKRMDGRRGDGPCSDDDADCVPGVNGGKRMRGSLKDGMRGDSSPGVYGGKRMGGRGDNGPRSNDATEDDGDDAMVDDSANRKLLGRGPDHSGDGAPGVYGGKRMGGRHGDGPCSADNDADCVPGVYGGKSMKGSRKDRMKGDSPPGVYGGKRMGDSGNRGPRSDDTTEDDGDDAMVDDTASRKLLGQGPDRSDDGSPGVYGGKRMGGSRKDGIRDDAPLGVYGGKRMDGRRGDRPCSVDDDNCVPGVYGGKRMGGRGDRGPRSTDATEDDGDDAMVDDPASRKLLGRGPDRSEDGAPGVYGGKRMGGRRGDGPCSATDADCVPGVYGGKRMGGSRKDGMRGDAPPGVYGGKRMGGRGDRGPHSNDSSEDDGDDAIVDDTASRNLLGRGPGRSEDGAPGVYGGKRMGGRRGEGPCPDDAADCVPGVYGGKRMGGPRKDGMRGDSSPGVYGGKRMGGRGDNGPRSNDATEDDGDDAMVDDSANRKLLGRGPDHSRDGAPGVYGGKRMGGRHGDGPCSADNDADCVPGVYGGKSMKGSRKDRMKGDSPPGVYGGKRMGDSGNRGPRSDDTTEDDGDDAMVDDTASRKLLGQGPDRSDDGSPGVYGGKRMGGSRKDGMRDDAPLGVYGGKRMDGRRGDRPCSVDDDNCVPGVYGGKRVGGRGDRGPRSTDATEDDGDDAMVDDPASRKLLGRGPGRSEDGAPGVYGGKRMGGRRGDGPCSATDADCVPGVYGGKRMGGSRKDGMRGDAPPGVYGGKRMGGRGDRGPHSNDSSEDDGDDAIVDDTASRNLLGRGPGRSEDGAPGVYGGKRMGGRRGEGPCPDDAADCVPGVYGGKRMGGSRKDGMRDDSPPGVYGSKRMGGRGDRGPRPNDTTENDGDDIMVDDSANRKLLGRGPDRSEDGAPEVHGGKRTGGRSVSAPALLMLLTVSLACMAASAWVALARMA
eukprot:gene13528-19396_t